MSTIVFGLFFFFVSFPDSFTIFSIYFPLSSYCTAFTLISNNLKSTTVILGGSLYDVEGDWITHVIDEPSSKLSGVGINITSFGLRKMCGRVCGLTFQKSLHVFTRRVWSLSKCLDCVINRLLSTAVWQRRKFSLLPWRYWMTSVKITDNSVPECLFFPAILVL